MRNFAWLAVVVALLTGCAGHLHDPVTGDETPKICHEINVAEPIDPSEACPSWRRIALKTDPDSACPDPGGMGSKKWKRRHLFTADNPGSSENWTAEYAGKLPPILRPFCIYEFKRDDRETLHALNKKLNQLIATPGRPNKLQRVDNGCVAVGPASDPSPPSSECQTVHCPDTPSVALNGLEKHFLSQVGDVESVYRLGTENPQSKPRVRLSLLDTQASQAPACSIESTHAAALARIAQKISCEAPECDLVNCTAEIEHRLALPILELDRTNPEETRISDQSGFSGFIDKLASEVWDAVRDHATTPWQRSVLNLSVAWDGQYFGGLEDRVSEMPVAVQAMHRALEVASCRGTLVVAAAGNRSRGPGNDEGPLLPGGWERRDAPTREACRAMLDLETDCRASVCSQPEPLVYAAGGVRSNNSLLENARPGGIPPRVAYGDHGWVEGVPFIKPLTGSSVSTAVISSIAATAWYHWPFISRADLMDLMYRAGEDIGRTADFYHASFGGAPETRRVSLCSTLEKACDELGGNCPEDCAQPPSRLEATACDSDRAIDAKSLTAELEPIPFCKFRRILFDPTQGIPANPCLTEQYYDTAAWPWREESLPQPQSEPCMPCTLDEPPDSGSGGGLAGGFTGAKLQESSGKRIDVHIAPNFDTTLTQAFLDIDDLSLSLGVGTLNQGECFTIKNLDDLIDTSTYPYISIRFLTEDHRVVSSPVFF